MNLYAFPKEFPTEDAARDYWIQARWPQGIRCVKCDHAVVYRIDSRGKSGKPRRLFECANCGLQFSPTSGTILHSSHLPLQKWFTAIALMREAEGGVSGDQMSRQLGVSYSTAWNLCRRIRSALEQNSAVHVSAVKRGEFARESAE